MRHTLPLHLLAGAAALAFAFACGGRSINDFSDTGASNNQSDGAGAVGGAPSGAGGFGGDTAGPGPGVGPGAGPGAGPGSGPGAGPGSGPGSSVSSTGPGGPQDCFTCAIQNCPEAVACFTDPVCQDGILCGVSNCLGGGIDPQCFLDCFNGDTEAALNAFQALTCVFQNCGNECAGFLGGP